MRDNDIGFLEDFVSENILGIGFLMKKIIRGGLYFEKRDAS
jgi:hypothetical protein